MGTGMGRAGPLDGCLPVLG